MCVCNMKVMGMIASVMHMMLCSDCCCNVYAYFLCKPVYTSMILMQS